MADDLLDGMDAPRPLPDALRARLEEQLLDATARPLGADLEARLQARLTDPVASALEGIDTPRALSAEQRSRLETSLVRRRRAPWLAGAAAALVAVAVGAAALLGGTSGPDRPLAGRQPSASPAVADSRAAGGAGSSGGTGVTPGGSSGTTGTTGGGAGVRGPDSAQAAEPGPSGARYDALKDAGVLEVAPSVGTRGTTVELTGGDLRTVVEVLFGDQPGDGIVVQADGSVTVHGARRPVGVHRRRAGRARRRPVGRGPAGLHLPRAVADPHRPRGAGDAADLLLARVHLGEQRLQVVGLEQPPDRDPDRGDREAGGWAGVPLVAEGADQLLGGQLHREPALRVVRRVERLERRARRWCW